MAKTEHKVYELVGSEYVDRGGWLDDKTKIVCYSAKGKVSRLARLPWSSYVRNTYRVYWEDVPQRLMATEDRVRASVGAQAKSRNGDSEFLKEYLTWAGCGRAVSFGRINATGSWDTDKGYTTFVRCSRPADETGFCYRHKQGAGIDGKIQEI
jgi:hypothetical protein